MQTRAWLLLASALAALLGGCVKTPPGSEDLPPSSPTYATVATAPLPGGDISRGPLLFQVTHDYTLPNETRTFEIPDDGRRVDLNARFTSLSGKPCDGGSAVMAVWDPAGEPALLPMPAPSTSAPGPCALEATFAIRARPGVWTVRFEGAAPQVGAVEGVTPPGEE